MLDKMVTLPAEAMPDIRKAIAIGMSATAEIERIENIIEISELGGSKVQKELHPVHPTGGLVLADFASALMWLDCATPVKTQE